jgi:CheY-like chemotaxis protein
MPLILAIEPNKSQAQQIASLVKHHLKGAELVSAADAGGALKALGHRVPDLVLTPALLAPRDEAALTEHLRQLGAAGSHIHTLAVPIIATAKNRVREVGSGLLGRRKDKADGDSSVGCDPSMFAEQIKVYLDRAAREREASVEVLDVPETHQAQSDETDESGDGDFAEMVWLPDEPAVVIEAPPPPIPVDPPLVTHHVSAEPEPPVPVIEPERPATVPVEQQPPRVTTAATRAFEAEFGLPTAGSGTPLWRVAEVGIEALTEPEPVVEPEPAMSAEPPVVADEPQIDPAAETQVPVVAQSAPEPRHAPKGAAKPARARKPAADDWTYFDPYQSPFKALVRRLDEIAGHV